MAYTRLNALDQALDIAGSLTQLQTMTESEEPSGFGAPLSGQTGSSASVSAFGAGVATFSGLTGMTANSVGGFLTVSGAATSGNNGTFLIVTYNSATSVDVSNPSGASPDANDGYISWTERNTYRLEDDINYIRTDRKLIKGTTNWYDAVPTYQRPSAVGTSVPANLTNIASKTTDAVAYIVNRAFYNVAVSATNTLVTLSSAGNFKHADATNRLGVPVFDAGPFAGDWQSCYVHIVDGYSNGAELTVQAGPNAGERIFGVLYAGSSTSPNSVEVRFYSSPFNLDYTVTQTPYTWESGQSSTINVLYGYNERLDQLDANALRSVPALGILTDASLDAQVNNLVQVIGIPNDGYTNLNTLLTNTGTYFPFYNLPDATPSIVEALNVLNEQIGNRTYTGSILTSGQTITASLQALSTAVSSSEIKRTIERLGSNLNANTAHTLPGGISYTVDGTFNGKNLFVFTRGVLRTPGNSIATDEYSELSSTQVTFYYNQKAGDVINYFIKG